MLISVIEHPESPPRITHHCIGEAKTPPGARLHILVEPRFEPRSFLRNGVRYLFNEIGPLSRSGNRLFGLSRTLDSTTGASLHLQDITRAIIHRWLRIVYANQGMIPLLERGLCKQMKTPGRSLVSIGNIIDIVSTESARRGASHHMVIDYPRSDERLRGMRWQVASAGVSKKRLVAV